MIPAPCYCATSIVLALDIEIVGEDNIRKVLDLLDHDVCTVIVGVLQRWSNRTLSSRQGCYNDRRFCRGARSDLAPEHLLQKYRFRYRVDLYNINLSDGPIASGRNTPHLHSVEGERN